MSEDVNNGKKSISELRFNLGSKDWVLIATGRGKRPDSFAKQERVKDVTPESECVFCNIESQEKPVLEYKDKKGQWALAVIPNKYPAFTHADSLHERAEGPYSLMDGVGFHEVVVSRGHHQSLAEMSHEQARLVINSYQERYLALSKEEFVNYISIFHNHGREAGASVGHPHSQIIAIPLIDPDVRQSLNGSRVFFENQGECVHCKMIEWEQEDGRRIIFENKDFIALAPFASRVSFEVRIYPKIHQANFEKIVDLEKDSLVEVLQAVLKKMFSGLNDPPYNFFVHTSPCDGKDYTHYHWYIDILPKTATWAGFELGAGIEISTIEPEKAAEYLREIKS
jgi:UDPglucose--hexose-1-phosphate uridylyltransferase